MENPSLFVPRDLVVHTSQRNGLREGIVLSRQGDAKVTVYWLSSGRTTRLHATRLRRVGTYHRPLEGLSDLGNPLEETERTWLYAYRQGGTSPKATPRGGKWLIFVPQEQLAEVWSCVRQAVEEGLLGECAKTATARPNANAKTPTTKVICVYTYDAADHEDVLRVLHALRDRGIQQALPYKEDAVTRAGDYSHNTPGRVSRYYARAGHIELTH